MIESYRRHTVGTLATLVYCPRNNWTHLKPFVGRVPDPRPTPSLAPCRMTRDILQPRQRRSRFQFREAKYRGSPSLTGTQLYLETWRNCCPATRRR